MFEGPQEQLDQTINSQPAILATSIAYLRALEERLSGPGAEATLLPMFYAGHSMGQYSAMVAAGVISLADGLRLVRERGRRCRHRADDGAMAAIIGLADDKVAGARGGRTARPASSRSPIATPRPDRRQWRNRGRQRGRGRRQELGAKRAIVLPVSVAAHSPLMAAAAEGMQRVLADVDFQDPRAPLLANADARPLTTADECRAELVEHLTRGVDWVAAVESMTRQGVDTFVEIGPGKVLTGPHQAHRAGCQALAARRPVGPRSPGRPRCPPCRQPNSTE